MDQHQQELRRIANQAFMQSLGQLKESLNLSETGDLSETEKLPDQKPSDKAAHSPQPSLDLEALEAAAADIEQAMQSTANEIDPQI
ncbi:MAG: hypothetical protein HY785_27265 [Oscillatoriophycideae cyanobacterium NC_groundwater_1537_Pr4_S-0.65um_50_18]|nr:hypothetical protein [Oscillatoriophycideae cyanobacterium NC_groundwater_1537_Pr4_S-0.65um_50_18]